MVFPGHKRTITITDPTPFAYGRSCVLFRCDVNGEDLCIKLFTTVRGADWDNIAAFEREVLAQGNLQHSHILQIVDYGLDSKPHGSPFVVLPFCRGGTLRQLLRERAFYPLSAVQSLLSQIAEALDFAHASGFVHGDVKPENLLLSEDRKTAYLSDFGMSNVFAIQERFSTVVAGPQGGTTAYLSPEQIAQSQQTPLSDIYALAMTTYELLTGQLPFDRNLPTFRQMLAKVQGELTDPLRFNPALDEDARAALLKGMATDPLKRPRSASEFCRLLNGSSRSDAQRVSAPSSRRTVFVSYSQHDAVWLERVRVHLKPLERQGLMTVWDDTRIQPGSKWREEIREALDTASVAVLLISSHFLASDFCLDEELPRLLTGAAARGIRILPVIVGPCRLDVSPHIAALQAVNMPTRTLIEMDHGEQERVLVTLANAVWRELMGT
jgi:serine/threonine protein kinase